MASKWKVWRNSLFIYFLFLLGRTNATNYLYYNNNQSMVSYFLYPSGLWWKLLIHMRVASWDLITNVMNIRTHCLTLFLIFFLRETYFCFCLQPFIWLLSNALCRYTSCVLILFHPRKSYHLITCCYISIQDSGVCNHRLISMTMFDFPFMNGIFDLRYDTKFPCHVSGGWITRWSVTMIASDIGSKNMKEPSVCSLCYQ